MNINSSLFKQISLDEIRHIFEISLNEFIIHSADLLNGGAFNTTYLIEYGIYHKKAVLRLGPINRHLLAGFEHNLMNAEKSFYSICNDINIPCSNVLFCDTSKSIIDRDFMIVEYVPSVAMSNVKLTESQRNDLYFDMGVILSKIHKVQNNSFGFLSRIKSGICFDKWSDALIFEIEDISNRLEKTNALDIELLNLLKQSFYNNRKLLDEVKTPCLLHTDLWEGNVLLNEHTLKIAAIIDGDRSMFGDTDFEFSSPWTWNDFLRQGYGFNKNISREREKRIKLYQIFYLLLDCYVGYCEYNDFELYKNRKKDLTEAIMRSNSIS